MNELEKIIEKYQMNRSEFAIHYHRDDLKSKMTLESIAKFFPALISFESPDIYSKVEKEILAIEHFEFDNSKNIKYGGSKQKHEEKRIEDKFNKAVYESKDGRVFEKDAILSEPSLKSYVENFTRNFDNHYNKVPRYIEKLKKENVIKNGDTYRLAFFIEDSTALGNYYYDENQLMKSLLLLYSDFF